MAGILTLNYGSNQISKMAKRASTEFDDARNRLNKVKRKINDLGEHSGHGYISSASAFLTKKAQQYEAKSNTLSSFARSVDHLMVKAENADRSVANHMESTLKEFKNITGLKGGFFATLGSVFQKIRDGLFYIVTRAVCPILLIIDVVKAITDWYQNLPDGVKYVLKLIGAFVGATLAIALAFAASGVIAIVGAVIVAVVAVVDYYKSCHVVAAYFSGDKEWAKNFDEMSTANFFGYTTNRWWGWDAHVASNIFTAVEVVGLVCNIYKGVTKLSEAYKNIKGLQQGGWTFGKAFMQGVTSSFFDVDDVNKARESIKSFGMLRQLVKKETYINCLLHTDISNILKGFKEIYGITEIGLSLGIFKPNGGKLSYLFKEIVKPFTKQGGIGGMYQIFDKVRKHIDNRWQLVGV